MPPLRYQWYLEENPVPEATNATLSLENLADAQSGSYRASVSNAGGLTWTEPAILAVLPVLSINSQPEIGPETISLAA